MKYYDEELRQWETISDEEILNEWMLNTAMHPCFAYELYDHVRYYVNIKKLSDKKVGDILNNKELFDTLFNIYINLEGLVERSQPFSKGIPNIWEAKDCNLDVGMEIMKCYGAVFNEKESNLREHIYYLDIRNFAKEHQDLLLEDLIVLYIYTHIRNTSHAYDVYPEITENVRKLLKNTDISA